MLQPLKDLLQGYNLVLASTSAQRKAIWRQIGLNFTSRPSSFQEEKVDPLDFPNPFEFVKHLATQKAQAVVNETAIDDASPSIIVGADTVIVDGSKVIGKPHTEAKAIETIKSLAGRQHKVCTGVAVCVTSGKSTKIREWDVFVSSTDVEFAELSPELIQSYVETGEPLNKAGAYGIQGIGALLVKNIHGDYYNVVGFPIQEFHSRLEKLLKNLKNK